MNKKEILEELAKEYARSEEKFLFNALDKNDKIYWSSIINAFLETAFIFGYKKKSQSDWIALDKEFNKHSELIIGKEYYVTIVESDGKNPEVYRVTWRPELMIHNNIIAAMVVMEKPEPYS